MSCSVLTTVLFVLALVQCCYAAGGTQASEDPTSAYLSILILNCVLYDITVKDTTSPSETTIREWIQKLNSTLKTRLGYSLRIGKLLVNRANFVRLKVRKMGGRARAAFFSCNWTLPVLENELDATLQQENSRLEGKVKLLQEQLSTSSRLFKTIQQKTPGSQTATERTPKHFSKRHERRLKKQHVDECTAALSWLEDEGLSPVRLVVMEKETQKVHEITLNKDLEQALDVHGESVSTQEADLISMMLYVKDKYNVSGNAYHEMASLCHQVPRHYTLKTRISELNSKWNLKPTPEGTIGIQQPLMERLEMCIERLLDNSSNDAQFLLDHKVKVKLTGDGTNLGKHLHVVNFVFTILDKGNRAHSAAGNHCIAIFKEPECYSSMKLCLEDIVNDVNRNTTITVRGHTFNIEYYLGGDWKFLAMLTGIDSASSTYACIWCKCPALDRYDTTQKWSITDVSRGARTIEENKRIARSRNKKFNVMNEPIFENIPLTRVVVDNLHMFLRVSDVLIDLLLLELKRLDSIDKATSVKSLDRLHYIKKYELTLKSLGINGFSFWIGRESKKLKCRTLTGPEKLILFEKLNIVVTFPEIPNCEEVQCLWRDLLKLNRLLSVRSGELTASHAENFQTQSKLFVEKFTELYPSKHVTPYMHCMMMHVSEFMSIHGAILPFTQHGLEKYNDIMTKDYFRSSSHRGTECLKQILQKQNRIEHLEHTGAQRKKKFDIQCTNCEEKGHNRLTCSGSCKSCGYAPYSDHLVAIEQVKVRQCEVNQS